MPKSELSDFGHLLYIEFKSRISHRVDRWNYHKTLKVERAYKMDLESIKLFKGLPSLTGSVHPRWTGAGAGSRRCQSLSCRARSKATSGPISRGGRQTRTWSRWHCWNNQKPYCWQHIQRNEFFFPLNVGTSQRCSFFLFNFHSISIVLYDSIYCIQNTRNEFRR